MTMKEPNKDSKEVCKDCKGTGVILYQKLGSGLHYSWVPWDKEPCKCTIKGKL